MGQNEKPTSLAAEAEWEIWYQDTFDRECPRQVEVSGQNLVNGLLELWTRHLLETIQADGQQGFSRFNLWWKQESQSIEVVGEREGMVRLREWVVEEKRQTNGDSSDFLLNRLAAAHRDQLLRGESSAKILAAANMIAKREAFEAFLLSLR